MTSAEPSIPVVCLCSQYEILHAISDNPDVISAQDGIWCS